MGATAGLDLGYVGPRAALALPRVSLRTDRTLEGLILAGAASGGIVGTSLVAGRHQLAVATMGASLHLVAAGTLSGVAFARAVPREQQPLIVGVLCALATLALLFAASATGL